MPGLVTAASRPSRLPAWIHAGVVLLVLLSFISGLVLWLGTPTAETEVSSFWASRNWRVLHGILSMLNTLLFGYLLGQHIRYGWALAANRWSGLLMESLFALLIISGLALYYGSEQVQAAAIQTHRWVGAALPPSLALHWFCARRWVRIVAEIPPTP